MNRVKLEYTSIISYTNGQNGKYAQSNQKQKIDKIYPLKLLEVEITLRCPLRCIHCSVGGGEAKVDLPIEKYKELVDDCNKIGVEAIDIIGGEPLAYPYIYEAIEYTLEKIPNLYLSTAGYFITEKMALKLKQSGLKHIFVSLDGPTKELHEKIRGPNTFEKTCEAIRMLSSFGFEVIVSFVATAQTYKFIQDTAELSKQLGAKKLFILAFIPEGRGKNISALALTNEMIIKIVNDVMNINRKNEDFEVEFDCSLKTFFGDLPSECSICPAGTTFATVKVNGDVFPCGFLRDHSFFRAGNIIEERFFDIWKNNQRFKYFRNPLKGCSSCSIYNECRGGCQALKRGKICDGKPEERKNFLAACGFI